MTTAMVEDHVHYHLQTFFVSFVYHAEEIFVGTITAVNLEIVGDGISMIRTFRHVVFLGRIQPDSGYTQIFQVIQMVFYTFQVTSMAAVLFLAVHLVFQHARYDVVVRIAVGETVRHDEIKHVTCIETFYL